MRKTVKMNGSVEASICASRGRQSRSTRRWSTAFLAVALGLATLGASASFVASTLRADEPREWKGRFGATVATGTLDAERTDAEFVAANAADADVTKPKTVYFRDESGKLVEYNYAWLSPADRAEVDFALGLAAKPVEEKTPESVSIPGNLSVTLDENGNVVASTTEQETEDAIAHSVDYLAAPDGEIALLTTEKMYDEFVKSSFVAVVKISAKWDPPGRAFEPDFRKQAGYFAGRGVKFAEVDVDEMGAKARELGVQSIPDIRVYLDGREYAQIVGYEPRKLANLIDVICEPALEAGARKVLTVDDVEYAFRWCPAGTFTMGSPEDEKGRGVAETQHSVSLSGFWMLETEVTQAMWKSVMGTYPSYFSALGDGFDDIRDKDTSNFPVEQVTWKECQEFITKLNEKLTATSKLSSGFELRFPTEAEWEYACRAGTRTAYSFGDVASDLATHGNMADVSSELDWKSSWHDGYAIAAPVKSYKPNAWGLYDMHGNVREWCADWYEGDYHETTNSARKSIGVEPGWFRVLRGGSWHSLADSCRSASRDFAGPSSGSRFTGFRLALGRKLREEAAPAAEEAPAA